MLLTIKSGLLVAVTLACAQLHAQRPAPLSESDFRVAGLPVGADSSTVRQALGAPLRITTQEDPYSGQGTWSEWHYRSVQISFYGTSAVSAFALSTGRLATARGLRVGSTRTRARTLYGAPTLDNSTGGEDSWVYRMGQDGGPYIKLFFTRDSVTKIYLGYSPD